MTEKRARIVFDADTGVLVYPSMRGARRAVVGQEYAGRVSANARSKAILLGIIGDPSHVKHVRIRSTHVAEPRERIISALGFFGNYATEVLAPEKKEKASKPVSSPTFDAIATLDLTIRESVADLRAVNASLHVVQALLREQNALMQKLVEKWQ